jgi:hypothetical protein
LWSKTYSVGGVDSVIQTSDNGYAMAGYKGAVWLVRVSNGTAPTATAQTISSLTLTGLNLDNRSYHQCCGGLCGLNCLFQKAPHTPAGEL